jgi:hypothetical protein
MGDRREGIGVRSISAFLLSVLIGSVLLVLSPAAAQGQAAGALRNPGFEGPGWQTQDVGTSVSSWLAADWHPWSVLGDKTQNREVEYKLITLETANSPDLRSHVHSGNHAQQFFTNDGSHTAGFYQRVQVPANSQVTFGIWVQIQTGQTLLYVDGRYVSDLKGGGGNYYAQVGIDPTGATVGHFGAPLPPTIQWSEPLWDMTAHGQDENGNPADLWVPISVSTRARGEWVTLYTRGQCKYPTKYNSSFWDDASLAVSSPPTPTPVPPTSTLPPAPTSTLPPVPTETLAPTPSPSPSMTATSTATAEPTATPRPSETPPATAEATSTPTATQTRVSTPTRTATVVVVAELAQLNPTATQAPDPAETLAPAPKGVVSSGLVGQLGAGLGVLLALALGLSLGRWLARQKPGGQKEE